MLIILALAGIPGILVAVFLTVQKFNEETEQIETGVARLASLGAAQHEIVLANAKILLEAVAKSQRQIGMTGADCQAGLKEWGERSPAFVALTLFGIDGNIICTDAQSELPYTIDGQTWFLDARKEQRFTLSDYSVARSGTPLLLAADAVLSRDEETVAIAVLAISLDWLDFIASDVDLPPEGTITAVGPEGQILTHRAAGGGGDSALPPSDEALQSVLGNNEGTLRAQDRSGATRVYGYSKTKSGEVVVMVGLPRFVEYSEWRSALLHTLLAPIVILLLAMGAAAWASEALVVRHVRSLITTTDEITEGNLAARSEVDYEEHELGELAAAIDAMAESLEEHEHHLEQQIEETQLVAREMQHRIANSLTLAQSIAAHTARQSRSTEEFNKEFSARLQALSASNRLLADTRWSSADLRELLELILEPYASTEENNVDLHGPKVRLDPRTAVALSLSVHELATNAAKYGALSESGGRITLRWTFKDENGDKLMSLQWRESGGPRPTTGNDQGFGTRLLQMMIEGQLGGRVDADYRPDGLVCTLAFRLAERPGSVRRTRTSHASI